MLQRVAGAALGVRQRKRQSAVGKPRKQRRFLCIGAQRRDQSAAQHERRHIGGHHKMPPKAFRQDADIGRTLAETAIGLGDRQREPSQLGHLRPQRLRVAFQRTFAQYLVRAVGEHALLIGISKVHGWRLSLAKRILTGEQATPSSRAMSGWPNGASVARLGTIMSRVPWIRRPCDRAAPRSAKHDQRFQHFSKTSPELTPAAVRWPSFARV